MNTGFELHKSAMSVGLGHRLKTSDVSHANEVRSLQPEGCNAVQLPLFTRLTTIRPQRQWLVLVKISPSLLTLTSSQPSQLHHHTASGIALTKTAGSSVCLVFLLSDLCFN